MFKAVSVLGQTTGITGARSGSFPVSDDLEMWYSSRFKKSTTYERTVSLKYVLDRKNSTGVHWPRDQVKTPYDGKDRINSGNGMCI